MHPASLRYVKTTHSWTRYLPRVDLLEVAWSMDIFFFFPSLSVFVLFIFDDTNENEKNKVQVVGGNYALVGKLFD